MRSGYIRLSFAFRRKEPCCDRGEYNNDEADDDAPAIQTRLVSYITVLADTLADSQCFSKNV